MKREIKYTDPIYAISPTESFRLDKTFGIGKWKIVSDITEGDRFAGRVIITGTEPRYMVETTPRGFLSRSVEYDFVGNNKRN